MRQSTIALVTLALLLVVGCKSTPASSSANEGATPKAVEGAPAAQGESATTDEAAATTEASPAATTDAAASPVTQVVVLEKEKCCQCTKTRQTDSRKALDAALTKAKLETPVTTIYLDTDQPGALPYLAKKPTMVTPGIYLMSDSGDLVAHLQGEVTEAQITEALTAK